jgi:hypothetical protein
VETFLTGCPAVSIHAFLEGMKQAGMDTFSMGIHEQLMDARILWLTPNTTTVYCVAETNVENGPTVMEVPPGVLGRSATPTSAGSPTSASPVPTAARAASNCSCRRAMRAKCRMAITSYRRAPTATGC